MHDENDFMLSEKRDEPAAHEFFNNAIGSKGVMRSVNYRLSDLSRRLHLNALHAIAVPDLTGGSFPN